MLERRLSKAEVPAKAVLPAWLVGELQTQGIPFTSQGRPDLTSGVGVKRAKIPDAVHSYVRTLVDRLPCFHSSFGQQPGIRSLLAHLVAK